jgi:hypothetical protein
VGPAAPVYTVLNACDPEDPGAEVTVREKGETIRIFGDDEQRICCCVLVEDDCDKICDGGWKERPYAWNPVGSVFIEGERKRKGIGYRIVKIYRYEETLKRINL